MDTREPHVDILAQALEQAPVATLIVEGPDARIRFANRRAREFSAAPEAPIGQTMQDFAADWTAFDVEDAVIAERDSSFARALRGEHVETHTVCIRFHDSTEVWAQVEALPLATPLGHPNAAVIYFRDVTEERKVAERRRLLEQVMQTAPVGVVLGVLEGEETRVTYANAYNEKMLPGQRVRAGQPMSEVRETVMTRVPESSPLEKAVRGLATFNELIEYTPGDGKLRAGLVNAIPLFDDDGVVVGGASCWVDVTHEKRLEQLKDDFVRAFHHDLGNPLSSIVMLAKSLLARPELPFVLEPQLALLQDSAEWMMQQLSTTLRIYQLESDEDLLRLDRFDVRDAIADTIRVQQPTFERLGIDCELWLPSQPLVMRTDRHLCESILHNLLSNAVKATPTDGRVQVAIDPLDDDRELRLTVRNPGVISPAVAEVLFEDRVVPSLEGAGLGSYCTGMAVRLLGGTIQASSSEAEGTRVVVRLPVDGPTQQGQPAPAADG